MKTSLIIPVIPKHFENLPAILDQYLQGTVIPDEVVISLSEAHIINADLRNNLKKNYAEKFTDLTLLETDQKLLHGPNRQHASDVAKNEILIYQDADDRPHPQRIEVIKYFFEHNDIMQLNHACIPSFESFQPVDIDKIETVQSDELYQKYFPHGQLKDCLAVTGAYGAGYGLIHAGVVSIRREVLEKVKWRDVPDLQLLGKIATEDYEFCMETLYTFNKALVIKTALYQYLNEGWEEYYIKNVLKKKTAMNISQPRKMHLVYAGNPLNDASVRAPETIANHLFRHFEKIYSVEYADWASTTIPQIGPDDIVLGHPHPNSQTIIQRIFKESNVKNKFLIFPFHHGIPGIVSPYINMVLKAIKYFSITGQYWYDTIDNSEFAVLKDNMVRVDMAIDSSRFQVKKTHYNPPGKRTFFYLGHDAPEKGVKHLAQIIRDCGAKLIYAGQIGDSKPLFDGLDVDFIGYINLDINSQQWIVENCDFFINASVSDANPTTILEMSALGLPVVCTPQSGYVRQDLVYSLRLNDHEYNTAVLNALQQADETSLLERSSRINRIVEEEYTWEKFIHTISDEIEKCL